MYFDDHHDGIIDNNIWLNLMDPKSRKEIWLHLMDPKSRKRFYSSLAIVYRFALYR